MGPHRPGDKSAPRKRGPQGWCPANVANAPRARPHKLHTPTRETAPLALKKSAARALLFALLYRWSAHCALLLSTALYIYVAELVAAGTPPSRCIAWPHRPHP